MARDSTGHTGQGTVTSFGPGYLLSNLSLKAQRPPVPQAQQGLQAIQQLLTPQRQNRPQSEDLFPLEAKVAGWPTLAPTKQADGKAEATGGQRLIRSIQGTHHSAEALCQILVQV